MKIINRANSGVNFEPYCVEFLHLCLNDENTINKIKILLYNKEANVFNERQFFRTKILYINIVSCI